MSVVFGQVEVPATGRSLVLRSPTDCGVLEFDLETQMIRRPMPIRAVEPRKKTALKGT